jgi:hypothetical protein
MKENTMSTKDAYKQKIEAELELVQANLDVLKAKAKNATADIRINYSKEIESLESNYAKVKSKLGELGEIGEGAWEHLKEDIEDSWDSLREYAKKTPDKINEIKKDLK